MRFTAPCSVKRCRLRSAVFYIEASMTQMPLIEYAGTTLFALAGLVVLGGQQQWRLQPILNGMERLCYSSAPPG
jgi:hypothetical protein